MGLMQREKGKRFERDIAARIRERLRCNVRRASQAERADNPDIFIPYESGEDWKLARLWLELQDARNPTPNKKLEQAEADIRAWRERNSISEAYRMRWPVVIWHRLGERTVWATMRINTLLDLVQPMPDAESELREVVTVELDAFLRMLEVA